VTILGFSGAAVAESVTVTPAVQQACEWDYHNLCGQYAIGSDLLDICFKQNGPKLSKPCVDALIAAGDTSQEYVSAEEAARPLTQTDALCLAGVTACSLREHQDAEHHRGGDDQRGDGPAPGKPAVIERLIEEIPQGCA
jgi:hypothetical protein